MINNTKLFALILLLTGLTKNNILKNIINSSLSTILLFLLKIFRIKFYRFDDIHAKNTISKLEHSAERIHNYKSDGFIYGKGFIGYISKLSSKHPNLQILAFESAIEPKINNSVSLIKFAYDKYDSIIEYEERINLEQLNPRQNQIEIVNDIVNLYREKSNVVVYIHGEPGVGKSTIALLVAKMLNGKICFDLDPIRRGHKILALHASIIPEIDNPLIIVLEEADTIIEKIHYSTQYFIGMVEKIAKKSVKGSEQSNKEIYDDAKNKFTKLADCEWSSKKDYNTFLDKINNGWYKNMIVIMTSNKNAKYINELDPSYLRKGRVNICAEIYSNEFIEKSNKEIEVDLNKLKKGIIRENPEYEEELRNVVNYKIQNVIND